MSLILEDRVKEGTTITGSGIAPLTGAASGFRTFSSVMADQDTTTYCIEGGGQFETGIGTFIAASGLQRNTVLVSSQGGAVVNFAAGNKFIYITGVADRVKVWETTVDPAPPNSGNWLYSFKNGTRWVPTWEGPSGVSTAVQPGLFANNVTMWLPGTGTTASINFGTSWTITGTQATPTIANTNEMTQMKRATFSCSNTGGSGAGIFSASPVAWVGNISRAGGFFFNCRFGIQTFATDMRVRVGLSAQATILAADPSTVNDSCGVIKDSADTAWFFLTRDTVTPQKINANCNTFAATNSGILDFCMFCKPNGTEIGFRLQDAATGQVYANGVSQTLNLPTASTMLVAHAEMTNVTAGVLIMFLNKIYVESDT